MSKKNKGRDFDIGKITAGYVDDDELSDVPARLFRRLLRRLEMNVSKWTLLVNDYLRWEIRSEDPVEAKKARQDALGNIKQTYFKKPILTFPKLLAGLSIIKMKKCEVILRVTDQDDRVIEVSEVFKITSSPTNTETKQ